MSGVKLFILTKSRRQGLTDLPFLLVSSDSWRLALFPLYDEAYCTKNEEPVTVGSKRKQ
jgi:hypothetical protein